MNRILVSDYRSNVDLPKSKKLKKSGLGFIKNLATACIRSRNVSSSEEASNSSDESTDSEDLAGTSWPTNATSRPMHQTSTNEQGRPRTDVVWREALAGESIGVSHFRQIHSGSKLGLPDNASPLQYLLSLMTEPIIDNLIANVNSYAQQKLKMNTPRRKYSTYSKWTPLDRNIFMKFLATLINMGLDPKHSIKDFWSTKTHRSSPWFGSIFSRTKFLLIYQSMLHAAGADAQGKCKIEPFINELVASFQNAFYPSENICIDEMVIGHKGRFRHKQYNASKPKKYHIKSYGLCDSITGYVFNLLVYFGADTTYRLEADTKSTHAVKIFDKLLEGITGHHHLFADRYYSSLPLVQFLRQRNHHYTGTLNANRRGFPPEIKNKKITVNQPKWFINDEDQVMCVSWRDKKSKKPCQLITTCGSATCEIRIEGRSEVQKPSPIHNYNMSMNGCDRVDQMISYYGNHTRKTVKWWKKVFMWVLEITQLNAHILYTLSRPRTEKPMPLSNFKDILIEELCSLFELEAPNNIDAALLSKPGRKSVNTELERYQGTVHLIDFGGKDRQCAHCAAKQT